MKETEQLDMEEVFQLLEEENKVFTKAVSQLFLNVFEYILDSLVQVVRRKALEALLKYVDEQYSWLEGEEEKLKAAGLKSLDDK